MFERKLIQDFPSLAGHTAILFRYHRWDNSLFLQVNMKSQFKAYLVCHQCHFFEFERNLDLDKVKIIRDLENLILQDTSHKIIVKCVSLALWDRDKFHAYDMELYKRLGEEKRYGIRKPITSIEGELYEFQNY